MGVYKIPWTCALWSACGSLVPILPWRNSGPYGGHEMLVFIVAFSPYVWQELHFRERSSVAGIPRVV